MDRVQELAERLWLEMGPDGLGRNVVVDKIEADIAHYLTYRNGLDERDHRLGLVFRDLLSTRAPATAADQVHALARGNAVATVRQAWLDAQQIAAFAGPAERTRAELETALDAYWKSADDGETTPSNTLADAATAYLQRTPDGMAAADRRELLAHLKRMADAFELALEVLDEERRAAHGFRRGPMTLEVRDVLELLARVTWPPGPNHAAEVDAVRRDQDGRAGRPTGPALLPRVRGLVDDWTACDQCRRVAAAKTDTRDAIGRVRTGTEKARAEGRRQGREFDPPGLPIGASGWWFRLKDGSPLPDGDQQLCEACGAATIGELESEARAPELAGYAAAGREARRIAGRNPGWSWTVATGLQSTPQWRRTVDDQAHMIEHVGAGFIAYLGRADGYGGLGALPPKGPPKPFPKFEAAVAELENWR